MFSLFRRNAQQVKSARRAPRSARPRLEALEDRCLLSAPGTLDTSFGSGGIVTTSFGTKSNDYGGAVAVQSDGKVVVAGISYGSAGKTDSFDVVRYNPNGTLDSTFGNGGEVMNKFPEGSIGGLSNASLLIQPDGKILLGGTYNNDLELIRFNANGSLDTTFGGTGEINTAFPYTYAGVGGLGLETINGVTKIVAAGDVNGLNGFSPAIALYNLDGSLDTSFGSGGEVVSNFGYDAGADALSIQPDRKIVVASTARNTYFVARYDLSGNLDSTFGTGGVATGAVSGEAGAVIVQPDGKIVAGGEYFDSSLRPAGWAMERLNSDGSLDPTFGTGGVVEGPSSGNSISNAIRIRALAIQTNGKLVAAGTFTSGGFTLVRYNPNGSLDTTFGDGGEVTTLINGGGSSVALTLQADGKILAAGSAAKSSRNTLPEFALVRYWGDPVPVIGSFTANPNPITSGSVATLTASNITDGNPNSTITQVTFYYFDANGNKVVLGTGIPDGSGDWILSFTVNLAAGSYTLYAQAEDNYGALSDPDSLTLTVN